MGEEKQQRVENSCFLYHNNDHYKIKNVEVLEEEEDDGVSSPLSSISSTISNGSSSSNMDYDNSSSLSNSCSSSLYDLSELMSELPIKRGLSMFYHGKSESFTSLSRVTSIEDLAKKPKPYRISKKIMKTSKSYGGGLDTSKLHTLPKPLISKKSNFKGLVISSSYDFQGKKGNSMSSSRLPSTPKSLDCGVGARARAEA